MIQILSSSPSTFKIICLTTKLAVSGFLLCDRTQCRSALGRPEKSLFILRNIKSYITNKIACQNKTERGPHLHNTYLAERLFEGLPRAERHLARSAKKGLSPH